MSTYFNGEKATPPTENHAEQHLQVKPSTRGSVSPPGGASRQSYSRSASNCSVDDDRASDFEDEPVPYCQSHMEEIRDAPTPVGNLVDRVQVCRRGALFFVLVVLFVLMLSSLSFVVVVVAMSVVVAHVGCCVGLHPINQPSFVLRVQFRVA